MKRFAIIACGATTLALTLAGPAHAATDYQLELIGTDGAVIGAVPLNSWSFGVCNSGQCVGSSTKREAASGMATGKSGSPIQASQNSQSLRESPTRASTGKTAVTEDASAKGTPPRSGWDLATNKGARTAGGGQVDVATGDLDGDGVPDFAVAATQDVVYGLSWTVDASPPSLMKLCEGKHIAKATLQRGDEVFEISDAAISCSSQPPQAEQRAGINRIDSTPARISTNLTVARQTQQSSFGERCQAGMACAGAMTITVTSGQMKYTKTGHVTLMK